MYTVLTIICHPDDMEINCAGTLLKCKDRGDRVVVCNLCNGSLGHMVIKPKELIDIRLNEAQKSCFLGGFEHISAGFDDLDIYDNNKESTDRVVKIIREINPDFIITHYDHDYMPDHVATSRLAISAASKAANPAYEPEIKGEARKVPVFCIQPDSGVCFTPTEYVDITNYMETKLKMVKCHSSQYDWLLEHDNVDLIKETEMLSRYVGYQCGVEYAEGFTIAPNSPARAPKRMLP